MPDGNGRRLTAPFSLLLASWLAAKAPHRALFYGSRVGGFLHYWFDAKKRRGYLANTSSSIDFGPSLRPWTAFQNHALNLLELLRMLPGGRNHDVDRVTLHGGEHIDGALARGRGLILATFHTGNWELSGITLAQMGYPITTIAGEQLRKGWSDEVKTWKKRFGIKVIGTEGTTRELFRDLQANRIVVLHVDGNLFTRGFTLDFLGKQAVFARGPSRVARVSGAPVSLAYCVRENDSRLRITVEPPTDPPQTMDDEYRSTRAWVGALEKCILDDPGQWCIFRRLQDMSTARK
jgi:lauroyl/myristoyl acyltransferase